MNDKSVWNLCIILMIISEHIRLFGVFRKKIKKIYPNRSQPLFQGNHSHGWGIAPSFNGGLLCFIPVLSDIILSPGHNARSISRGDLQIQLSDAETEIWCTVACHAHLGIRFDWSIDDGQGVVCKLAGKMGWIGESAGGNGRKPYL